MANRRLTRESADLEVVNSHQQPRLWKVKFPSSLVASDQKQENEKIRKTSEENEAPQCAASG